MNEELEREVLVMCNLSQGVKAEGISIGEMRMLVKLVRKGRVTIEEAAKDAGMTVEKFEKVLKNTPLGRSLWQDSCVCHRCDRDLSGAFWEECILDWQWFYKYCYL